MAERSAKQLGLSKADLPNSIIEVIATLSKSGFDAYIVGGGVRDTLLGLNPKDFDAVTDAKPHEIKDIFGKRCRIIGRRFQLAHVYSGRDMIEVATFRAPPNGDAHTTSDGMIVRDNVWGDIQQDFARRDFSINAMYYEPIKGIVHDFCNALDDIDNKIIRLLGHAPLRVEEDPVRLLRALRFKAKLGFDFDDELSKQFHDDNWSLLDQVSPHRLYDESQKMFTGGYLVPLLPLLFEYGAIKHLIIYPPKQPTALVTQVAVNTDKRIAMGKSINPAFFYAALLWDNYLYQLAQLKKKNMPFHDAQLKAASKVIDRQRIKTAIPKFAEQFIRDIWIMQPKLASPKVKQIPQLAEHARFRAAFDFLLLREQCDDEANPLSESTNGMGEWWQTYQTLSEKQQRQAIDDFANDTRRSPSKPSRNRRSRNNKSSETQFNSNQSTVEQDSINQDSTEQHSTERYDNEAGNKTAKEPRRNNRQSSKNKPKVDQSHRYAKERSQLQKLSLGLVAGDESKNNKQPRPLFVIDEEKIARQVPNQLELIASEKAEIALKANKASSASERNMNLNGSSVTETGAKQSPTNKANTLSIVPSKSEPLPSKRRRRMPTQEMTQAEMLENNGENKDAISKDLSSDTHSTLTSRQSDASKSEAPKSDDTVKANKAPLTKGKRSTPQKSEQPKVYDNNHQKTSNIANNVTVKSEAQAVSVNSERIPTKRHRRQPSSDKSISERLTSS